MRMFIFIALFFVYQQGYTQDKSIWVVTGVKTNYIQKGISDTDYFKPPMYLLGKEIIIKGNVVILSKIIEVYNNSSALSSEFGDTLYLEKNFCVIRRKDNELSIRFPGDELTDCILHENDACPVSNHFLNLLGIKDNKISASLSVKGKYSKTRCILFFLNKGQEIVLYSENDFLLLFLSRKQIMY